MDDTDHPCDVAYRAGKADGHALAVRGDDAAEAEAFCNARRRLQDDAEAYADGFWFAFHRFSRDTTRD